MNKPFIFYAVLVTLAVLAFIRFGAFDSEAVALCKEAMELNVKQLNPGAEGRKRLLAECQRQGDEIRPDAWRCVIAAMKKGGDYRDSLTQCTK